MGRPSICSGCGERERETVASCLGALRTGTRPVRSRDCPAGRDPGGEYATVHVLHRTERDGLSALRAGLHSGPFRALAASRLWALRAFRVPRPSHDPVESPEPNVNPPSTRSRPPPARSRPSRPRAKRVGGPERSMQDEPSRPRQLSRFKLGLQSSGGSGDAAPSVPDMASGSRVGPVRFRGNAGTRQRIPLRAKDSLRLRRRVDSERRFGRV